MSYTKRNTAIVRDKQNLIDIAVQEYGDAGALFTLIEQNPNRNFTIDSVLDPIVTEPIYADNQTAAQDALVTRFDLDGRVVVNEDADITVIGRAFSDGFSLGFS